MFIPISFVAVTLTLARVASAHPFSIKPTPPSIHVPGLMHKARNALSAPAGLGMLSALPLGSLLGGHSALAGDGDGDSDEIGGLAGGENDDGGGDPSGISDSMSGEESSSSNDADSPPSGKDALLGNGAAASPLKALGNL